MFIGRDFPTFEDGQSRVLGFDLTAILNAGETIESATASLMCWQGTDQALASDPAYHFSGNVLLSGNVVTQGVVFDDPDGTLIGNVYALSIAAQTSRNQVITPWARFTITIGYGTMALPAVLLTSDSGETLTGDDGSSLTTDGSSGMPTVAAQIIVLPTPLLKLTLPGLSGYASQNYPTADVGEHWFYGVDFSPALSPGETITNAVPSLVCVYGDDPVLASNPKAYFGGSVLSSDDGMTLTDDSGVSLVADNGTPQISGNIVEQLVAWPLPMPNIAGNVYVLGVAIATSFGQGIAVWSRIAIGVGS